MKAEDMRSKSADELKELVVELRKEQMSMRFQSTGGQLEKTDKIKSVRRDIARAKTLMAEKARGDQKAVSAKKAAKAAKE